MKMFIAIDKTTGKEVVAKGVVEEAQNSGEYLCIYCGAEMRYRRRFFRSNKIATKSFVRPTFFAISGHKNGYRCLDFEKAEKETEKNYNKDCDNSWHKYWQAKFPIELCEYYMHDETEYHIADVFLEKQNTVIEFQHSYIKENEFNKRTDFYARKGYQVIWLFDGNSEHYSQDHQMWLRAASRKKGAYIFKQEDNNRIVPIERGDLFDQFRNFSISPKEFIAACYDFSEYEKIKHKWEQDKRLQREKEQKQREKEQRQREKEQRQREEEQKQREEEQRQREEEQKQREEEQRQREEYAHLNLEKEREQLDNKYIEENSPEKLKEYLQMFGFEMSEAAWSEFYRNNDIWLNDFNNGYGLEELRTQKRLYNGKLIPLNKFILIMKWCAQTKC